MLIITRIHEQRPQSLQSFCRFAATVYKEGSVIHLSQRFTKNCALKLLAFFISSVFLNPRNKSLDHEIVRISVQGENDTCTPLRQPCMTRRLRAGVPSGTLGVGEVVPPSQDGSGNPLS